MRSTISALIVAAGLAGFAVSAQAAPVAGSQGLGVTQAAPAAPVVRVQMMRHRMMRHRMMRHRMMRRRMMHRM